MEEQDTSDRDEDRRQTKFDNWQIVRYNTTVGIKTRRQTEISNLQAMRYNIGRQGQDGNPRPTMEYQKVRYASTKVSIGRSGTIARSITVSIYRSQISLMK